MPPLPTSATPAVAGRQPYSFDSTLGSLLRFLELIFEFLLFVFVVVPVEEVWLRVPLTIGIRMLSRLLALAALPLVVLAVPPARVVYYDA